MLSAILRKKSQVIVSIMILSVFFTATAAFAATKAITASDGGTVRVTPDIELVIESRALKNDILISARMLRNTDRICFNFGPDGTSFAKNRPAELRAPWKAIADAEDLILWGEDGKPIEPQIEEWGVIWHIPHFSLYYYRRR